MAKTANISLPDEVMNRLDEEARKLGLNRSAYISMALNVKWQNEEVIKLMPQMIDAINLAKSMEKSQNE